MWEYSTDGIALCVWVIAGPWYTASLYLGPLIQLQLLLPMYAIRLFQAIPSTELLITYITGKWPLFYVNASVFLQSIWKTASLPIYAIQNCSYPPYKKVK
jgi:hypothetical protein